MDTKEDNIDNSNEKDFQYEQEFEPFFNATPIPTIIVDEKKNVISINDAGKKFFAYGKPGSDKTILGEIIQCTEFSEHKKICGSNKKCAQCGLLALLDDTIQTSTSHFQEELTLNVKKKNMSRSVSLLVSTAKLSSSREKRILLSFIDITHQKKVESDLIKAMDKAEESDRLKTSFLYNLSHEIRTPLNGIMGFSDILLNSDKLLDIRRFANIINKSGRQILNVVDDLTTISSLFSGSITVRKNRKKLADLFEETKLLLYEEHMASEKSDKLELHFQAQERLEGKDVDIDSNIFRIIVKNLIRNAFKFTDEGYIEFGISEINDNESVFYIKDTGIGIPDEKHDLIFQLFRQGSDDKTRFYGGTGTGLTLSKSLLELIQGRIWLDSQVGKGSTFFFSIPLAAFKTKSATEKNEFSDDANNLKLSGKSILVVEDNTNNFILLDEILSSEGANVLHATSGEEAIYIVETNDAVDLVLMDLQLPHMSGFKATQLIKTKKPDLSIIAQSAFTMPEDRKNAMNHGCDDFIAKPINNSVLIKKVTNYIH